ncbi:hypothetical protein GCM10009689_17660 [Brevibacterium antiquum]|uniref:hypothetical protein n=1 Tax=Brevibacterium antiquum TaxID=234835 RepID=UPI0018DF1A23|nr:hypothetical protein [Brevibacterium antiquum]
MRPDESEDYSDATTDALSETDVSISKGPSDLADAIASGVDQRNGQQKFLFKLICLLVGISFLVMIAFVLLFGFGVLELTASGEVAAIAAVGVQPFILIGILTTSVYRGSSIDIGDHSQRTD